MSDQNIVDTFEVNGYTVNIFQEDDQEIGNPRDADNLGVMLAKHPNYTLGDQSFQRNIPEWAEAVDAMRASQTPEEFITWAKETLGATVVLPLWLLDHSGLAMSTAPFAEDPGNWDSGIVGFIFDTERTRELTGAPLESIEAQLTAEVAEYSMYLEGDVYGFQILDPEGEIVDSCGGFLGREYVKDEATSAAENNDQPQWVVITGDLRSGLSVVGPYPLKSAAEEDANGGTVMLLSPPPEITVTMIQGPQLEHPGKTMTQTTTHAGLKRLLAAGWLQN